MVVFSANVLHVTGHDDQAGKAHMVDLFPQASADVRRIPSLPTMRHCHGLLEMSSRAATSSLAIGSAAAIGLDFDSSPVEA
ncbi:hypothetical protein [Neorhizobium sp. JUb45]|uniref:hypothetical protein n=1 Tax=unclassified Neorhizobium TaxID=2629175 RepID=UPI00104EAFD0|nr:hypothetical protein [Neorhizobium sp. JUb45]